MQRTHTRAGLTRATIDRRIGTDALLLTGPVNSRLLGHPELIGSVATKNCLKIGVHSIENAKEWISERREVF